MKTITPDKYGDICDIIEEAVNRPYTPNVIHGSPEVLARIREQQGAVLFDVAYEKIDENTYKLREEYNQALKERSHDN